MKNYLQIQPAAAVKSILLFLVFGLHKLVLFSQCGVPPVSGSVSISTAGNIVNSYYPGTGSPAAGTNSLVAGTIDARGSATVIAPGDLVMIIQMQGADHSAANSDAYGDGVAGAPASGYTNNASLVAGYYEYNTVSLVAGATITFSYNLINNYYTRNFTAVNAIQRYQVIRVPRYYDLSITAAGTVIAPFWDGNTGGVIVLDCANTLTLNGTVTTAGRGFRGGGGKSFSGATAGNSNGAGLLANTDYRWNSAVTNTSNLTGGAKGEGICGTPIYTLQTGNTTTSTGSVEGYINGSMGRGSAGNAGGGGTDGQPDNPGSGNQFNPGGGGGANAGNGGQGGSGWHGGAGSVSTYPTGGYGAVAFAQRSLQRLVMGGGGGAGTANNSNATNEYHASGGSGGGIIITRAKTYAGSGSVNADGADAPGFGTADPTDAAGGGGAGGSIIVVTNQSGATGMGSISMSAKGGKGGDMTSYYDHGPGGGAGGGYIITNGTPASTVVTGGTNGKTRTGSSGGPITNNYGATSGGNGQLITLSSVPVLGNASNIAAPCGALPVHFIQFSANYFNEKVLVSWSVSQEVNAKEYVIERSLDGREFNTIGVQAYYISNTAINHYSFSDNLSAVSQRVIYYRIKQIDNNGSYAYSKIMVVRITTGNGTINIFPNPAQEQTTISFTTTGKSNVLIRLVDMNGKIVKQFSKEVNAGLNTTLLDNLGALPAGMYHLQLYDGIKTATEKLVITQ
jgi:Secretion system C-terminal sorting domain